MSLIQHKFVLFFLSLSLILSAGCGPKRLKELSHRDKNRTEEQMTAERLLEEGSKLFDRGDLSEAQQKFFSAIEAYPGLARAHLRLADVYQLEGDEISALAENAAFTETAKTERLKIDRMADYLFGKYARNPASHAEVKPEEQILGMLAMSQAIVARRQGQTEKSLTLLDEAQKGLPRAGLIDYLRGHWLFQAGNVEEAYAAFEKSVEHNGYFGRKLLNAGMDSKLPELASRMEQVLVRELKDHPADLDSAVLLGSLCLRRKDGEAAVKAVREALAWGQARWDLLVVKAAGYAQQGKKVHMEQALADLKSREVDLSKAFSIEQPSIFHGAMADSQTDFIEEHLLAQLREPARSYFEWRWRQERADPKAEAAKAGFFSSVASYYPEGKFAQDNRAKDSYKPASLAEYMGAVQSLIDDSMRDLWSCDDERRQKRATPSGRVMLRIETDTQGEIGHISIEENTTKDPVVAYCALRKLLDLRLPQSLRKTESFKLPVMFGPEVDGWKEDSTEQPGPEKTVSDDKKPAEEDENGR